MKTGWIRTRLSDVATVQSGAGFPDRYQGDADGEIPFYKVSDMNIAGNEREMIFENNSITERVRRKLGAFLFPEGSTIFPKIGGAIATNKKRLTTRACCVDNNVMGVIPKPGKLDSHFLFFFFLAHDLSEFANDAHLPSIKKTVVEGWSITLPTTLTEQRRIVRVLDEAFAGIATAVANARRNLQNAGAIFESQVQSVFTQRGPQWVDIALGNVCGFVRGPFGGSLKKSIFVGQGYAVYEQQHAIYDRFDNVRYFIDEAKFKEMKRFELLPNDLIMSCSGTMGRVAIVPEGIKRGVINQALLKLTPSSKISSAYLKSWMESEGFKEALREYSGGAAIQNVASVKILKEIKIPLPSVEQQERIVNGLNAIARETQRLESIYRRKLAAVEALKKSLLHQAFSGEL